MRLVVIESPYAGDVGRNLFYLRAAMLDCLRRAEAPFASHGLYTQPGVLDDDNPADRELGILAGFAWRAVASATVVYTDLGITTGMNYGIAHAGASGRPIEYRTLPGWDAPCRAVGASSCDLIDMDAANAPAKCEHCGKSGERRGDRVSPDGWLVMFATFDANDDKSPHDRLIVHACSVTCRDALWTNKPRRFTKMTFDEREQPAIYPCGCSKHKINLGLCDVYDAREVP